MSRLSRLPSISKLGQRRTDITPIDADANSATNVISHMRLFLDDNHRLFVFDLSSLLILVYLVPPA